MASGSLREQDNESHLLRPLALIGDALRALFLENDAFKNLMTTISIDPDGWRVKRIFCLELTNACFNDRYYITSKLDCDGPFTKMINVIRLCIRPCDLGMPCVHTITRMYR